MYCETKIVGEGTVICKILRRRKKKNLAVSQRVQEARDLSRVLMDGDVSHKTAILNLFFYRPLRT